MSEQNRSSLESFDCDDHRGSKLCYVSIAEKQQRKLLCPRCLLKHRLPYDSVVMIDDFIEQRDIKGPAFQQEALDEVERQTIEGWIHQTRNIEAELDSIVDEFSELIEEFKTKLREDLSARQKNITQRKENYLKACKEHLNNLEVPDRASVVGREELFAYILALEGSTNRQRKAEREILLTEGTEFKQMRRSVVLDKSLKEFSHTVRTQLRMIPAMLQLSEENEADSTTIYEKVSHRNEKLMADVKKEFVFSEAFKFNAVQLSNDKKEATSSEDVCGYFCVDTDLASFDSPVRWRVRIRGRDNLNAVGIVSRKVIRENGYESGEGWMIFADGRFYYEEKGPCDHGLDIKDAVVEIVYDPRNGEIEFECGNKRFAKKIKPEKDLVPGFCLGFGCSMELLQ